MIQLDSLEETTFSVQLQEKGVAQHGTGHYSDQGEYQDKYLVYESLQADYTTTNSRKRAIERGKPKHIQGML